MKVPNAAGAIVERGKILDYLLNPSHPDNGGKARFFQSCGFTRADWQRLAAALKAQANAGVIAAHSRSAHGQKYVVVGHLAAPAGDAPVKTIWIVDTGSEAPRLITAYPYQP